jgi:2-polyprenyl-3-methyl-5-hydroxy-6-metoxy-1,4-benzoquinol methylase
MNLKEDVVKLYFDNTEVYLKNNISILTRSLIVKDLLGKVDNCTILDLGSGDGSISLQFLSNTNHITMVDISKNMLMKSIRNTPQGYYSCTHYINANLSELEINGGFDIILCLGVLAHVESVEVIISKAAKLLNPGGRCIFQITDNGQLLGRFTYLYYTLRNLVTNYSRYQMNKMSAEQIILSASEKGLSYVACKRYSLVLPGMGILPRKWLEDFEIAVLQKDRLSRYGSEAVLLFQKDYE